MCSPQGREHGKTGTRNEPHSAKQEATACRADVENASLRTYTTWRRTEAGRRSLNRTEVRAETGDGLDGERAGASGGPRMGGKRAFSKPDWAAGFTLFRSGAHRSFD